MSEEVDLIVVTDRQLAEQIVAVLKRAGIRHVEFWPEHMLRPSRAYSAARHFSTASSGRRRCPTKGSGPSTSACRRKMHTRHAWLY